MRFLPWKKYGPAVYGFVLVFVIALVSRLVGVGQFLTADEKNWVGRGWEFSQAMSEFRFNDTFQTTHPGIPTLWVAGISSAITARVIGTPFSFERIHTFVTVAQVPMAVANSLLVAGMYLAARALMPTPLALVAALAIALDPFLVAHGKLVHVDGLSAGTTTLALLLLLASERLRRHMRADAIPPQLTAHSKLPARLLVLSAIVGGLAVLSKVPGAIIVPMALLILLVRRTWEETRRDVRAALRLFFQWFTVLSATILVLWPGLLWVPDPIGNVKIVKRDLATALATPHHMSDEYALRAWQYPATILSRSTIPTLLGLAALLCTVAARSWKTFRSTSGTSDRTKFPLDLRTSWTLVVFIVLFTFGMTVGAKKGDRYLLPIFPVLDLLAVSGVTSAVVMLRPRWSPSTVALVTALFVVFPLAYEDVRLGRYALAHYNPFFRPNLSQELGWGEGLDQVAAYLNGLDDRNGVAVASWYPEELRALVRRPVHGLGAHQQIGTGYVVLYRNMFGRPPSHPANDFINEYYQRQAPVFTARVNGLDYAWVYRRPVYDDIIGELVPGKGVVMQLPADALALEGVEVFLATYRGGAKSGVLLVRVRESEDGPDVRTARRAIRPEDDNVWVKVSFPPLPREGKSYRVVVSAEETRPGEAPTIRVAPREKDGLRYVVITASPGSGSASRVTGRGRIGIRPIGTQLKGPTL